MKIVLPKAEILPRMEPLKKIELCGRVCYKSEDKITKDSAPRFCRKLYELGHTSVFEHARVIAPLYPWCGAYGAAYRTICEDPDENLWCMNARDYLAGDHTVDELMSLPEADDYMSVRFTCDRAIANELVRHRVFSFSQCSTRYVNYKDGVEFILPVPFEWAPTDYDTLKVAAADPRYQAWYFGCEQSEEAYLKMIREGCTPQEARDVLPLSTKTELIMTGMYSKWADMLKLRLDKAAHPQMQYLMKLLVNLPEFPKDKIKLKEG